MRCGAVQCSAVQCSAVQCNAMQCNAMQCNAMQYTSILPQLDPEIVSSTLASTLFKGIKRIKEEFCIERVKSDYLFTGHRGGG